MLYKKSFATAEEAKIDYERLQNVLTDLKMVTLETSQFQSYGGPGEKRTLLGCPGAVELQWASWDKKSWEVTVDLKPSIVGRDK